MTDRQFVIEPLNGQSVNIRSGGEIVGRLTFVSSRVTGTTAGAAASLVTWAGNGQSAVAGATVTPPAVRVLDANGLPVAGSTVTWEGNAISGATQQGLTGTSDSNGVVTLGGWSVGTTAGSASTVFAYSGNLTNSPIRFSITPTAASAFSIAVSAGNSQSSTPLSLLASRLTALAQDRYGNNVNGASVTWTSSAGDAAFGTAAGTTNSSGLVGTTYTTGQSASTESVWAAISSATSARFGVGVYAAPPTTVDIVSGDNQTALSGATLAQPLVVFVGDGFNNPWSSGQTVQFVVVGGSGNVSSATSTPDANGLVSVTWKMGATAGTNRLEVSLANISGSTVTFTASGTNPVADTIQIESGNSQTGTAGSALALPLAVATLGSGSSASGQLVTFSATSGSLSTSATPSSTSGIARTVWTLPTGAGTYTVTASSGTLAGSPLVFSATATSGTATQLVLATQPSSQPEVGVAWPQQPVVVSADQYGNPASTNTRVQCVLLSGDGTLDSGVSTFATASGATATFSGLSYTYASVNSFQVGFRCNSLSTVTASVQTSQAPFASKLAFTTQPPSSVATGATLAPSPQVTVQDALGATVTTATNAVTVSISAQSGSATLGGTLTRNAVAGVATFTDLTLDSATTCVLAASATGLTGAVSSQVVAGAISAYPNKPSNVSIIADRDFAAKVENGWTDRGDAAFTIQTTATDAMCSQFNRLTESTGRASYTTTFPGGSGPIYTARTFGGSSNTLYVMYNMAVSSNWSGHSSNVNKVYFIGNNGSGFGLVYTNLEGKGSGALTAQTRLQGAPKNIGGNTSSGAQNISSSTDSVSGSALGSFTITRGQRFTVELLFGMNSVNGSSIANADGVLRMWVNGQLRIDRTNMAYRGKSADGTTTGNRLPLGTETWGSIIWNPTYGGSGGSVNQQQYMYMYDCAFGIGV